MFLQEASIDDAQLLFEWVNEPVVRMNSFSQEEITFENHLKWLKKKLSSTETRIMILMIGSVPVGQVRIDYEELNWIIDYSIDKNHRGNGYGKTIIDLLINQFQPYVFIAKVKNENIASRKVFLSLGFKEITSEGDLNCFKYKA